MSNQLPPIVIQGTGGHGRVIADIILRAGQYALYGFLDDIHPELYGTRMFDVPIVGGREQLDDLLGQGVRHFICGIGDNAARMRVAQSAVERGFALGTAVHPSAVVGIDVTIGAGTVVMAGAVINPCSRIGQNVIINTASSVDHDCEIGDGAHIGPGVHLGGHVRVGQGAWIGIGASVKDRIEIGAGSIVGAGAVVVKNLPTGVVAYGVPAQIMRKVQETSG